ncbi:PWWP domain-containing DNA repair factor 3A isoform X2 [Pseudophryne corroboree]|uniref:PWWP domain-containing DNA repair factor 3A isoform X2 n=1 Tax=Pseudophryne corroboree TaxID=495146 RepID=UPI00308146C4
MSEIRETWRVGIHKVVSKARHLPKNNELMVKIFAVNEKINVKFPDTKPFLRVELDKIGETLDRTENCEETKEELTYRRALREALEIISRISKSVTENVDKLKESTSAGSQICIKTETTNEGKECDSSTVITEQKRARKRSKAKGDLKTIKERDFSTATTNELSVYPKGLGTKTLSPLTKPRHIDNRKISRKRQLDTDEDFCGKITTLNVLSHSNITADQQCSPKNGIARGKLKGSPCSAKEVDHLITASVTGNRGSGKICPMHSRRRVNKNKVQKIITKSLATSSATDTWHDMPEERGLSSSSELSMEISSPESNFLDLISQQDDTEEDIQLPVIALQQEPVSFVPGSFVWCKYQRFPYWPSLVQAVYSKDKKVRVIFLDHSLCEPNEKKQSYKVAFHALKHYDCPEKQQLMENPYKDYSKFFVWCNAVICDYRIRLGCGSFSGSFIDYCTADISLPVRRERDDDRKWIFSSSINPGSSDLQPEMADSKPNVKRKLLPDRKRAARDRENIKLVDYIVRTKRAENHLLGILKGKKKSKWLKKFQSSIRRVNCLETYLEDEDQMELVVAYLQTLCGNMNNAEKKLMNGDQTRFVLEVLLPEAVIFAISATDQINYEKAEMKYLKGPSVSKRERKQFEEQILEKKRLSENLDCEKGSN